MRLSRLDQLKFLFTFKVVFTILTSIQKAKDKDVMRYFMALFLMLGGLLGSNQLAAVEDMRISQYLTHGWYYNHKSVWLEYAFVEELQVPKSYYLWKSEGGKVFHCDIDFWPLVPGTVFSEKGYEIKKIQLRVQIGNASTPNTLACERSIKVVYENVDGVTKTRTFTRRFQIKGYTFDPTEDPEAEISSKKRQGSISFRCRAV